jgi:pimeloyl-ACP methyl ester carboxylesterase
MAPTPPPGRLIDIGTHRLHLHCLGRGTPTVVFDPALGASSLSWSLVHAAVATLTRACVYDRAGFGWSDAGPRPRTAGRLADELRALLRAADVDPPFILVGHSYGGLVAQLFTARHREEVAGLVLIEPAIPEEWTAPSREQRALITKGERRCRYGEAAARHGIARVIAALARAGALAPARALVRLVSRGGLRREDEGFLAPVGKLPPAVRRLVPQAWVQPKFFSALGSQIGSICDSAAEVLREALPQYGQLPLALITSEDAQPARMRADAALAGRSERGRHVLAANSGHWVPLDAPDVVIDTIAAMIAETRP